MSLESIGQVKTHSERALSLVADSGEQSTVAEESTHSLWRLGRRIVESAREMTLEKSDPSFKAKLNTMFQAMTYRHNRLYQAFKKEKAVRLALESRVEYLEALLSVSAMAHGKMIDSSLRSDRMSPVAAENKALKDMLKETEQELIKYKSAYRDAIMRSGTSKS